jgi:hypothetical protein
MNPRSKFEQEKNQAVATRPHQDEHGNEWVTAGSQRQVHRVNWSNEMPPDSAGVKTRNIPLVTAGDTDVSGLPKDFGDGFRLRPMNPWDDDPTNDPFYDAENGTWVERGNVLDRG